MRSSNEQVIRPVAPITGRAAMLARTAVRQAPRPEPEFVAITPPHRPAPWLQELRARETARQDRIARWRAGRFEVRAEDKRAAWPRSGTPEAAALRERIQQRADARQAFQSFRAPGNPGVLSERERESVAATRHRIARQAARGPAPAPTRQASAR